MRLSNALQIRLNTQLGKYLGHQILHKGRNKGAHMELVERVRGRLEGWKVCCLSKAGRFTLAQSVLGSLQIFQMQFENLPEWVHNHLGRAIRSCVWEKHDGARGVHLINWETLTKLKRLGGLISKWLKK